MSKLPQFQTCSSENYGIAVAGLGEGHDFGIYPQATGAVSLGLTPERGVVSLSVTENLTHSQGDVSLPMARTANEVFGRHYTQALEVGVPAVYAAGTAVQMVGEYVKDASDLNGLNLRVSLAAICMGRGGEQVLVQAGHSRICGVQMSSTDGFRGLRRLTPEEPTLPIRAKGNVEPFIDELPASSQFRRFMLSTQDVNIQHHARLQLGNIARGGLYRAARHLDSRLTASHLYTLAGGFINANKRGGIVVADVVSQ